MNKFGLVGDIVEDGNPFGLVGDMVLDNEKSAPMRLAGGLFDNALGNRSGSPLGGIVGMATQYPSEEVYGILQDAMAGMEDAIGYIQGKTDKYKQMGDQSQRRLGAIPAGETYR